MSSSSDQAYLTIKEASGKSESLSLSRDSEGTQGGGRREVEGSRLELAYEAKLELEATSELEQEPVAELELDSVSQNLQASPEY